MDDEIGIVDISNYSEDTSYTVLSSLFSDNLTRIDKYVTMRYSYNLPTAIETLCSRIKVDKIYLPKPVTSDEVMIYEEAERVLSSYRTEILTFRSEDMIAIDTLSVMPIYNGLLDNDKDAILFSLIYEDEAYTYASLPMLEGKQRSYALNVLSESESIIIGNHGSKSEYKFNYVMEKAKNVVFASDKIFIHSSLKEYYDKVNVYYTPESVSFISK